MEDIDIQKIRKENFKLAINKYSKGSVPLFAEMIGKHRTYTYAMIKDMQEKNSRKITDKMCRNIESILKLNPLSLDSVNYKNSIPEIKDNYMSEINLIPEINLIQNEGCFNLLLNQSNYIKSNIIPQTINNHNIAWFEVNNDFMAARVEFSEKVFIEIFNEISINQIINGAIYLISYNKQINLVRIFSEVNQSFLIKVDNPLRQNIFPQISISSEQLFNTIQIFGRVVGSTSFTGNFL